MDVRNYTENEIPTVVITGSTRGIGKGLAAAFLELGASVVVSGRKESSSEATAEELAPQDARERVHACACDVRVEAQVEALWECAYKHYGGVDIWVNNAGLGLARQAIWKNDLSEVRAVLEANIWGTMLGSAVAARGMLAQGGGAIYNMEGLGTTGRRIDGLAVYGTTKYGLDYFNQALIEETRGSDVLVGTLSPGMVVTDLTISRYRPDSTEAKRFRRVMNLLGDKVENVAPWLAIQMMRNQRHGARLKYLTWWRLSRRLLRRPFWKRDILEGTPLG
jgi:NAD(P)-dependent dehydrogenase (short-subunit alcohol dehydrogenase family)